MMMMNGYEADPEFERMLTPDVYQNAVRTAAKRYLKLTYGAFRARDFVHTAIANIMKSYKGRYHEINDLGALLTTSMLNLYLEWIRKTSEGYPDSAKAKYLWTQPPEDFEEEVGADITPGGDGPDVYAEPVPLALTTTPETDHMIREHDVARAIATLPPDDQTFVRLYMASQGVAPYDDHLSLRAVARHYGQHSMWANRRWTKIRLTLAERLAEYAPLPPGKTLPDSHQDREV
jgi:RNA polymerase sigma factor (sigma-70 family)